jgi:hypothetical protein
MCTFDYETHLLGVRLTVNGLAFQQQDLGSQRLRHNSALWSSLQRAQARWSTTLVRRPRRSPCDASQFALCLSGGRCPPRGLSLGPDVPSRCKSLGYSPSGAAKLSHFDDSLAALLFSSISSGMSPVLIIKQVADVVTPDLAKAVRHAVAAVGAVA